MTVEPRPPFPRTTGVLTFSDHLDHFLARWGVNRGGHRVAPGLYALGNPCPDSPVCVTANYSLSFDALRSGLAGLDAWLLVLDTKGVNVWCAAGEGTFATKELINRVSATGLAGVVRHRRLIVPQLGASGVSARVVERETGFAVDFGPIMARDLPLYLRTGTATPAMRRVTFTLAERVVLIPVELVHVIPWLLTAALVLFLVWGAAGALAVTAAVLAGTVVYPVLLPWLPTRDFASQGLILGLLAALPFAMLALTGHGPSAWWVRFGWALTAILTLPPVTAYLTLNFTGSTPFTSRTGVRREILTWVPVMAWLFGSGLAVGIVTVILSLGGGR
jgi:hypothetical protein